ncbi:MAG: class I SAM-dependent methyltransferase [Phyllobacteriaceae bacterium]|jgi:hypothetical protein|nr:class I SAM-dependent methyltransferase [Phyllobacteriaceae bacterium]
MALTRDEVIWAYRMFLGRDPGDEQIVNAQMQAYENVSQIRNEFSASLEFKMLTQLQTEAFVPPFLLPKPTDGQIVIDVPTLNDPTSQMCTHSQMQEGHYTRICGAIGLDPTVAHRKHWEWVYICRVFEAAGLIKSGASALVFAVGRERLPAYFASNGVKVLATDGPQDVVDDWSTSDQYTTNVDGLFYSEIVEEPVFRKSVEFRTVDMNHIPTDLGTFDFLWSSCSLEHLGSLEAGFQFVLNSLEHLKPGGMAVHTTELNLSSNEETFEGFPTCIYRRRDIDAFASRVREAGYELMPINYFMGTEPLDRHIDYPPHSPPHLRLALGLYVSTSIGLVIRRPH